MTARQKKMDLVNACDLLQEPFNTKSKKNVNLEDINNFRKDYNRGFLPTFIKLAGYTIYRSKRKNLPRAL